MFYYTINDDVVLSRDVRKKNKTTEAAVEYIRGINSEAIIHVIGDGVSNLYERCKSLVENADEFGNGGWFVSENEVSAKAAAIISVIERNRMWKLLMSKEDFEAWVKRNVR